LETIFEDTREYQGEISLHANQQKRSKNTSSKAVLKTAPNKAVEADLYLETINKKLQDK
jgi:hypothetical protein